MAYADDTALLCLLWKGMQSLIDELLVLLAYYILDFGHGGYQSFRSFMFYY